jgi:hypothetical protein
MLISLNELPSALRAHVTTLRACVRLALDDFATDHTKLKFRYTLRTEASIINDYMVWYAKDRFPWKLRRNLFLVQVGPDFRAKLKKLTGGWGTRNIQTNMVLQYEQQRPMRLFDDMDLTHLFLGYQRNDAEISKSSIWLVCPQGKGIKWIADLTNADDATTTIDVGIVSPTDPNIDAGARRIKPRVAVAEEETGESKKETDNE